MHIKLNVKIVTVGVLSCFMGTGIYAQTNNHTASYDTVSAKHNVIDNANNAPANTNDGVCSYGSHQPKDRDVRSVTIRHQQEGPIGAALHKSNRTGALMGTVRSSF